MGSWLHQRQLRWWLAGLGFVSAVLVVGAWLLWPDAEQSPDAPRAREYREYTACLLTDEHGIAADPARVMWAGMQSASVQTRVKVQYLAIVGDQSPDNGVPFLRSLAQGHCGLIFGAGALASTAIHRVAGSYPQVSFFVTDGAAAGNVVLLDAARLADDVGGRIRTVVEASPAIR